MHKTKEGYWHHNHCTSKCTYVIVFCPKNCKPVLEPSIQSRFKQLVKQQQTVWNFEIISMTLARDHVQIILQCEPNIGINNLVAKIKGYTASQLKAEFPVLTTRIPNLWTRNRLIQSLGVLDDATMLQYIAEQKSV